MSEPTFRGHRPSDYGLPKASGAYKRCDIDPPAEYQALVEARILAHRARVAREMANMDPDEEPEDVP